MNILSAYSYDIIGFCIATILLAIAYTKWKFTTWEKIGVPSLNPVIFFGDAKESMLGKCSFGEQFQRFYDRFKAKGLRHGGIYMGLTPMYIPVDPLIIKHIIQVDFQHFINHGLYFNEKDDPLSGHLFNLEDEKWRNMRIKLTPTFTSGKMKMMFETMTDCTVGLKTIMDESAKSSTPIDIKETLSRFTTDVIGSVGFGLECNSLKNPDAPFVKYGKRNFDDTTWERIKGGIIQFTIPHNILRAIGFKITKPDVEAFFMKVVKDTVAYREKNNIHRKDFMHLLLQLKNRGSVYDDEKIINEHGKPQESALTINELAAQAFVFFLAGFETSSTTMTFALYELARNPDIQEKLRREINDVLSKHNNKLTYGGIMEMTYMEQVINETLRKYPPAPVLGRKCNKDYLIPNTNVLMKEGTEIFIPILGVHNDPEYYPNPTVFDPERFSEENKKSRPPFTWLPFGEGPRACIGLRFGMLQSRVGLATLLQNYKIRLSDKTQVPLTLDKRSFILTAKGGIWLDIEKLY